MEVGIIPKIEQYKDNKNIQMQQVASSTDSASINNQKDLQQIQKEAILKTKESDSLSQVKVDSSNIAPKYETLISNVNFGYNRESKDFYIKVERGNVENQYPTEEMMKVKAYILSMQEASTENSSK